MLLEGKLQQAHVIGESYAPPHANQGPSHTRAPLHLLPVVSPDENTPLRMPQCFILRSLPIANPSPSLTFVLLPGNLLMSGEQLQVLPLSPNGMWVLVTLEPTEFPENIFRSLSLMKCSYEGSYEKDRY